MKFAIAIAALALVTTGASAQELYGFPDQSRSKVITSQRNAAPATSTSAQLASRSARGIGNVAGVAGKSATRGPARTTSAGAWRGRSERIGYDGVINR